MWELVPVSVEAGAAGVKMGCGDAAGRAARRLAVPRPPGFGDAGEMPVAHVSQGAMAPVLGNVPSECRNERGQPR